MKKLLVLLLALVPAIAGAQVTPPPGGFGGVQLKQNIKYSEKFADINYAGDNEVYHTLDIYLPEKVQESYPVVIHIYGSAWFSNNSKGAADIATICAALLDAGYAVVTPNHRSSSDAKWPAQLHDIKAVIRFVRANAAKYHFNTSFIATSGFSSGGHLASVAAVTSGMKTAEIGTYTIDLEGAVGPYTDQSSEINAACDWSGPVDLMHMDCAGPPAMQFSPEEAVIGAPMKGNEDKYRSLSAPTYVKPTTIPIIISHGKVDNVVPCCNGTMFYDTLKAAGVKCELNVVEGGGHGANMYGKENLDRMVNFLNSCR